MNAEAVAEMEKGEARLASVGARVSAVVIDNLIVLPFGIVGLLLMGSFEEGATTPGVRETVVTLLTVLVAWSLINVPILLKSGQTIGKKIIGIKIVSADGRNISASQIVVRYVTFFGLQLLPKVGRLLMLVNLGFVLRKNRLSIHDMVAKTKVINLAKANG